MERFVRSVEFKPVLADCFHNIICWMIEFTERKIKYRLEKSSYGFITFIILMASPSLRV